MFPRFARITRIVHSHVLLDIFYSKHERWGQTKLEISFGGCLPSDGRGIVIMV